MSKLRPIVASNQKGRETARAVLWLPALSLGLLVIGGHDV